MIKVNHDEVKSEIVSDVFYGELESKFSPYHNQSFGKDCDNKIGKTNVYNYSCEKSGKFKEISGLLDSGCTDHVVKDERMYEKFIVLKNPIEVKLPDGKNLKATKVGNIKTYFKNYHKEKLIDLKNVYFVKGINKNLLMRSYTYRPFWPKFIILL